MHPGLLGTPALVATWATVRARHYSVSYLIILAVIAGVGYLTIRRRRDHRPASPQQHRPSQGRNEFELHPSPAHAEPGSSPGARATPTTAPAAPGERDPSVAPAGPAAPSPPPAGPAGQPGPGDGGPGDGGRSPGDGGRSRPDEEPPAAQDGPA